MHYKCSCVIYYLHSSIDANICKEKKEIDSQNIYFDRVIATIIISSHLLSHRNQESSKVGPVGRVAAWCIKINGAPDPNFMARFTECCGNCSWCMIPSSYKYIKGWLCCGCHMAVLQIYFETGCKIYEK